MVQSTIDSWRLRRARAGFLTVLSLVCFAAVFVFRGVLGVQIACVIGALMAGVATNVVLSCPQCGKRRKGLAKAAYCPACGVQLRGR